MLGFTLVAEDFAVDWPFRISECVVKKNVLCSLKSEQCWQVHIVREAAVDTVCLISAA